MKERPKKTRARVQYCFHQQISHTEMHIMLYIYAVFRFVMRTKRATLPLFTVFENLKTNLNFEAQNKSCFTCTDSFEGGI